jgi:hypothetical protein
MVDAVTRATMVALLARWQMAFHQHANQAKIRDEAAKKAAEFNAIMIQCNSACKALGYDQADKEGWEATLAEFGPAASSLYREARTPDLPDWPFVDRNKPLPSDESAEPEAEQTEAMLLLTSETAETARPTVRAIALEQLSLAGDAGLKAADIRKYIAETYSAEIHEKTVGMTLYRLLKEEVVRRKGRTWFIVPHKAETMNPGGETPGLIETVN